MNDHLPAGNPKPPEHINNRYGNPFRDLLLLIAGALGIIVLATVLLAWSAAWIGPLIPYEWEVGLLQSGFDTEPESTAFESAELEPRQDVTALRSQAAIEAELGRLLTRLTGPDALSVQIHYLADSDLPNAFATLGGHIFVTRGLLESVESENGLAMVLAHEYAHVELRHPITLMLEQLSIGFALTMIGSDNLAQMVTQNTAMLTALSFSREMERDADELALERLDAHYGHTTGADEFFRSVSERYEHLGADSPWQQMFQTHPLTSERIEAIQSTTRIGILTPLPDVLVVQSDPPAAE